MPVSTLGGLANVPPGYVIVHTEDLENPEKNSWHAGLVSNKDNEDGSPGKQIQSSQGPEDGGAKYKDASSPLFENNYWDYAVRNDAVINDEKVE